MVDVPGAVTPASGDRAALVIDEGRTWPRHVLAAGPRPAHELQDEATAHGTVENALYAARKAEGITAYKEFVPNGRWIWLLAITESEREEFPSPST
jgi:hypothetical protein